MTFLGYTVQGDVVVMCVFAAALFWSLLFTSQYERFRAFFYDITGKPSIHRLLGAYVIISYVVYAGFISISTRSLPDLPWAVVLLVFVLLGLLTVKEGLEIWKGARGEEKKP